MKWWDRWRRCARRLRTQIQALLLASKHPRTPWLTLRLIPEDVWAECTEQARASTGEMRPRSWVAAGVIVLLWVAVAVFVTRVFWSYAFRDR